MMAPPVAVDGGPPPDPQRAVLVLPTTAEFDSRTYRIASALVARGHEVFVLGRQAPGLPEDEVHPAGYRIIRVPVAAMAGVPLIGPRWARRVARATSAGPAAADATSSPAGGTAPPETGKHRSLPQRSRWLIFRVPFRLYAAVVRRFAIFATIRSQTAATLAVAPPAGVYHGMAYMGVPIALALARRHGGAVVYDARDIYVDAANLARLPRPIRWLVGRAERRWARSADRVITVNQPYARVMSRRWGVEFPLIVMNCSKRYAASDPRPRRFHAALGLDQEVQIVLYQGGFSPDRGIEELISAIALVPSAVLVLLGYGVLRPKLEALAADPATGGRVHVLPAVPPAELLDWVSAADVVAMPIQPTTLNHQLTTPNKLFEAMAAGVPVVASDLPGMAPIVTETGCGLLCDPTDPASIAKALRSILDGTESERDGWRRRAMDSAQSTYNWEGQFQLLLAEYGRLTGRAW